MTAQEAFNQLNPDRWASTSIQKRLEIIKKIQKNIKKYAVSLGEIDAKMKNELIGEEVVSKADGIGASVIPMANTLMGIKNVYEELAKGKMPEPQSVKEISDELYEIQVFPIYKKDKLLAGKQKGYLHVEGTPTQSNPLDKPSGIIAISGAGNYSSSIEMAMALFLENKAVIHKPHQLNEASDLIWEKIFAPLIDLEAVAFCNADQGPEMAKLEGLFAIYFTGSTGVAHAILDASATPVVSECGGNNPCIIVPGEWTEKDIRRQAIQLASAGKLNGGAACGRPQTIVTSKNWEQRDQFLSALRKAIAEETFAVSEHYPGVQETKKAFIENQPTAEILKPESRNQNNSDFILIPNISEDDFAVTNEAFCQVFSEIPLDTSTDTDDFLTKATEFCNTKLLGTLGCMILVDNETLKRKETRIMQAIRELNYGGISVNDIPPNIWLNGYLTWGGCNEKKSDFISGVGNFGNPFNFENVKKSVIINDFKSTSFELTHKKRVEHLLENLSYFTVDQSWAHFAKLAGQMMIDGFKSKDF